MKDAYYFSHDSNAKDDPKCVLLIEQLGLEGYGIYWVLVETLRDQPEYKYPISLLPAIARRYNSTTEKVKTVVFNYGLFEIQGDEFFYSESLLIRMQRLEDKRVKASIAGKISAQKRLTSSTDVQQPFNECLTTVQPVKQSKTNEIILKENKTYKTVLLSEIKISDYPFLNEDYYSIAMHFYRLFEKTIIESGSKPTVLQKAKGTWIDDIRLIIETDGYNIDQLRKVYVFVKSSDFWSKNILSIDKLRKQMQRLLVEANKSPEMAKQTMQAKIDRWRKNAPKYGDPEFKEYANWLQNN
jgi:hypothetical protein